MLLPPLRDVQVETRGSTAIINFAPTEGAVDYRIYPLPEASAVETDTSGTQFVRNAVYRCAGKRAVADRQDEYGALYPESLAARINGYQRRESEAKLGYVFTTPGPGRKAVYRLADPNGQGGYANASWIPPLYKEANSADYVADESLRAQLLRQGFRDDGIAFYAPSEGDLTLYRGTYHPDVFQGARVSLLFTDGPELVARRASDPGPLIELAPRFQLLSQPADDAVPLYRVTYNTGSVFDVLAASEAGFARALHQAGPVTTLAWSGLKRKTTLVVEALDTGCPFPGAYIGAFSASTQQPSSYPTSTLLDLRSQKTTGEVFINGQHDPQNRPRPIARSLVEVTPGEVPAMNFASSFEDPAEF
ncbi:MAG TPA: hypothetical protein VI299_15665, partial [Polyangiales bacterium]